MLNQRQLPFITMTAAATSAALPAPQDMFIAFALCALGTMGMLGTLGTPVGVVRTTPAIQPICRWLHSKHASQPAPLR